jgi:hypothetical protein
MLRSRVSQVIAGGGSYASNLRVDEVAPGAAKLLDAAIYLHLRARIGSKSDRYLLDGD